MSYATLTSAPVLAEFAARAVPVTYNGSSLPTGGVFRFIEVAEEMSRATAESTRADQATLLILKSEVVDPGYGDSAVIDGKTWRIMRKLKGGGAHTHKVLVERNRGRVA